MKCIVLKLSDLADSKVQSEEPMDLTSALMSLSSRIGVPMETLCKLFDILDLFGPSVTFSIILKELAVLMDKKYKDHINNSEKIFTVSLTNGRIVEIDKNNIKNYRNFAAFRTMDEAKEACKITRKLLRAMFKNEQKSKKRDDM